MRTQKGFTLIELLVVIAIIGILSSVVLASLTSARARAQRAGAIATGRALIPEILTCSDDNGFISYVANGSNGTANPVCVSASNGTTALAGHSAVWSTLPSGWTYTLVSPVAASAFTTFGMQTAAGPNITCNVQTSVCQ